MSVDEQWASIEQRVVEAATYHSHDMFNRLIRTTRADFRNGATESPIEALFYAWWEALKYADGCHRFSLLSQKEVRGVSGAKYRLDFAVIDTFCGTDDCWTSIGIELDGHEFHERTKEQVIRRNSRDADLLAAGWKLLHVSGSELFADPQGCVSAILSLVAAVRREGQA